MTHSDGLFESSVNLNLKLRYTLVFNIKWRDNTNNLILSRFKNCFIELLDQMTKPWCADDDIHNRPLKKK